MNERDVFIAALQCETRTQRLEYIHNACGGDEALKMQVEALLEVHERAGGFLQEPVFCRVETARDVDEVCASKKLVPCSAQNNEESQPDQTAVQTASHGDQDMSTDSDAPALGFLIPREPGELGRLGHYRLLSMLGHGGMGIVFLANDTRLQRHVAVKVMRPELAANPSSRKRFLREARVAAQIRSDHVVSIFHVDQEGDLPYLVMEVLHGQSLAEKLEREKRLPIAECLRIARETANGLDAAHACGMIHRDVKPGNIWLEAPSNRVKLLDFGLARARTGALITQRHIILGTPAYMSPEQAAGTPLDERCDLFSLGAVLYHTLTGQQPFAGGDLMAVLSKLATASRPKAVDLVPELPAGVAGLLDRLLSNDPANRPSTAAEVSRELLVLEREVAGTPPSSVPSLPQSPSELEANRISPTSSSGRRRSRVLMTGGILFACMMICLIAAWLTGAFADGTPADKKDVEENSALTTTAAIPTSSVSQPVAEAQKPVVEAQKPALAEFSLKGHLQQVSVAFSGDSKTLVSGDYGSGQVIFWDVDRREMTSQFSAAPRATLWTFAIDPEKRWLAVAQMSSKIHLFRVGKPLALLLEGHTGRVMHLAFLRDGKTLLSTGYDGSIRSWDVETQKEGKMLVRPPGNKRLDDFSVWEDGLGGLRLATAGPNFIGLDNVQLETLAYQPLCVALSPDGKKLACPAPERGVAVWQLPDKNRYRLGSLKDEQNPQGLAFTPDGKYLVVLGFVTTRIYDANGGELVASVNHAEKGNSLAVSPDGLWLAVGTMNGPIRVWHLPTLLAKGKT
jgi:serine/threonine protein kinase